MKLAQASLLFAWAFAVLGREAIEQPARPQLVPAFMELGIPKQMGPFLVERGNGVEIIGCEDVKRQFRLNGFVTSECYAVGERKP